MMQIQRLSRAAEDFVQTFPDAVLAAAARGDLDLLAIVRGELASRGLDMHGQWIGLKEARLLHIEGLSDCKSGS